MSKCDSGLKQLHLNRLGCEDRYEDTEVLSQLLHLVHTPTDTRGGGRGLAQLCLSPSQPFLFQKVLEPSVKAGLKEKSLAISAKFEEKNQVPVKRKLLDVLASHIYLHILCFLYMLGNCKSQMLASVKDFLFTNGRKIVFVARGRGNTEEQLAVNAGDSTEQRNGDSTLPNLTVIYLKGNEWAVVIIAHLLFSGEHPVQQ
ncbi:hypothetical protein Q9966_011009 [Columba livia]|nr:hypothetical protein Q9966_011009 [Columba livia]